MACSRAQGVKGVIADATSFETARRQTRRQQKQKSADYTFTSYASPSELDARVPLNPSSDPESGDDEDFIRSWRKHRMAELRSGIATQRKKSPSKRKYGRVTTVDAVGYLDAIEKVSAETVVVVTIFNDEVHTYSHLLPIHPTYHLPLSHRAAVIAASPLLLGDRLVADGCLFD